MANTKLANVSNIISMDQQDSKFGSASSLANDSFTIPSNCGVIVCYPSAACHWTPNGTATSSFAHAVRANEPFELQPNQQGASIIGDAGSFDMIVAYMRGARRSDGKHTVTRPY